MRNLFISAVVLTFSATVANAEKPNEKGAGGQAVKEINEFLKDIGTNLGQTKKAVGYGGKNAPLGTFGADVSEINQAANH